ncbi:MAG TPA: threonylcarbamoyl-AMP synthase [Planctomycetaceae bacterium]|nr:threonylcarbamoyl-AMP synthase [Planctomycetaceae bacterium]
MGWSMQARRFFGDAWRFLGLAVTRHRGPSEGNRGFVRTIDPVIELNGISNINGMWRSLLMRIDLHREPADVEEVIRQCVDALQDGNVLVLPTETVYGVGAIISHSKAVERLLRAKGRPPGQPFSLAIAGIEMLHDFSPDLSSLAQRLARRCWPGPVTLVLPVDVEMPVLRALPETVRDAVLAGGMIGFRVPHHPVTQTILGELNEPIVLTSANRSGRPEALTVDETLRSLGDAVDVALDDGPTVGTLPSTVVRVDGDSWSILREGSVKRETIRKLTAKIILFVCTGNTCRSPMAEVICEKLLADRLRCMPEELEHRGYVVMSAGIAAGADQPASYYADATVQHRGLSLQGHRSQLLGDTQVRYADHIFALTRGHREAILSYWPDADTRLSVLRTDGGDITDPIGGSLGEYAACADRIEEEIENRLDRILAH